MTTTGNGERLNFCCRLLSAVCRLPTPMKRPPLIFRLMLCSLFLPIIVALCAMLVCIFLFSENDIGEHYGTTFGIPDQLIGIALFALPFLLWFWMLWKGNWRRPILVAAVVYGAVFVVGAFELVQTYTPPDKRMISLYGTNGTDVYCNGVHLGQLTRNRSLNIRVDELMAKVPEWTTPPEQRWYDDTDENQRLMTWIPWDNFRKERFEASRKLHEKLYEPSRNRNVSGSASSVAKAALARREALLEHDADCRYWWSFRDGESQMAFRRSVSSYNLNRSFDQQSSYSSYEIGTGNSFSPSVGFHAQLLVDVLPELTPEQKADWDKHVLKHWSLLGVPLKRALDRMTARHRRDKNESLTELYETALHSTARLKYNLSAPPTEDECRRLLADWAAESAEYRSGFRFDYDIETQYAPMVDDNVLLPAEINETMRKPLTEQWRNKWRITSKWSERGWAPIAYFSWQNKSPDYFADFARWSATTGTARFALLDNESPNTVALFNTLLRRRSLVDLFNWQIHLYPTQINTYAQVNNPLVEADFREYIVNALSDPKHHANSRGEVERAVVRAIFGRINRETIDKDDFSIWVSSLPIPASSKNLAQRMLRIRSDKPLTFADQLQQAAGRGALIETDLTLDDVVQWFTDNPEGSLTKFFKEQEENIMVTEMPDGTYIKTTYGFGPWDVGSAVGRDYEKWQGLPHSFVLALLRSDTPEGNPQIRELIRKIWERDWHFVESAIATEYGSVSFDFQRQRLNDAIEVGSIYLPEYIMDLYLSAKRIPNGFIFIGNEPVYTGWSSNMASTLAVCESPKAKEILEKWLNETNAEENVLMEEAVREAKRSLERCLEIWQTRNELRQRKMEVFQDLVAGRMSPDDLLLSQPAWVWKDGKYVQAE